MKKIVLLAIAALFTWSASAQTLKFARVNFTELLQLTPEADSARSILKAQTNDASQAYQDMMTELQSKTDQYRQKAATWTQAIRESKEKELADMQARVQDFTDRAQKEIAESQEKLFQPISAKVNEVVTKLAKEGGYAMVFDYSQAIYADDSKVTDLTPAARKALNIPEGKTLASLQQEQQQ